MIVFAVGLNMFQGCPVPNVSDRQLEGVVGHTELMRWTGVLNAIGVDVSSDEVAMRAIEISAELGQRHGALVAPFWPWFHHTNTRQRWSLFPVADADPYWMHVETMRAGGRFELAYRPNDPEASLLADLLEYRRVRGTWNPGREARPDYPRFVEFLAKRVFEAQPDTVAIRVRFLRYHVRLPGSPPDDETSWHFEEVRRREASR